MGSKHARRGRARPPQVKKVVVSLQVPYSKQQTANTLTNNAMDEIWLLTYSCWKISSQKTSGPKQNLFSILFLICCCCCCCCSCCCCCCCCYFLRIKQTFICEQVLFVRFYNNPAPLNGSMQFHYCTLVTREPEQTTLLFWSAACGVTPHGLHTADRR